MEESSVCFDDRAPVDLKPLPRLGERRDDLLVLIVEDDPLLRRALIDWMTARHFRVIWAKDCAGGIQQALLRRPHAILLDLKLPDASGLQLLRALRGHGLSIPFVVLTGNARPSDGFEAAQYGAGQVIEKPASPDQIALAIRTVVGAVEGPDPLAPLLAYVDGLGAVPGDQCRDATAPIVRSLADPRLGLLEFALLAQIVRAGMQGKDLSRALNEARREDLLVKSRMCTASADLLHAIKHADPRHPSAQIGAIDKEGRRQLLTVTGRSVASWMRLARLRLAVHELFRTDEQVAQIAQALGFARGGQLARDIHSILGASPRDLRRIANKRE